MTAKPLLWPSKIRSRSKIKYLIWWIPNVQSMSIFRYIGKRALEKHFSTLQVKKQGQNRFLYDRELEQP